MLANYLKCVVGFVTKAKRNNYIVSILVHKFSHLNSLGGALRNVCRIA